MTADNLLTIENLTKRYTKFDLALDDVSLTLEKGQVVALIGSSGAGKSTLIRCVNQLVRPSAGKVTIGGTDLSRINGGALRQARRQIGMIFQDYALVDRLSVMENVLSGQLGSTGFLAALFRRFPPQVITEAFELLDRVGLAGMENKRADQLSGGQRQRVGIARALLQNPALLLVDEPTASLDPKTSRQIMRLICELCQERGLAAIINIHDVRLAQLFCPRIVGLKAGQIVFDGPASDLTADKLTLIYGEEDWTAAGPGAGVSPSDEVAGEHDDAYDPTSDDRSAQG